MRIKFLNAAERHIGFQYQEGWNEDPYFLDVPICGNGLHFTDDKGFVHWIDIGDHWREVLEATDVIPIGDDKFKARAIKLGPRREIAELIPDDDAARLALINEHTQSIQYMTDLSESLQLVAVRRNGYAIQFIPHATDKVRCVAVRKDPFAIRHIPSPSETVQFAAVGSNPSSIQYIKDPSESVQLRVVRDHPRCIVHIKDPSEAVHLASK